MTPPALVAAAAAREVTSEIRGRLDEVEKLAPGVGQIDLGAYVRGWGDTGAAGGFLDYQHRATRDLSIFGQARAGYGWGAAAGLQYEATAGLRMRF